jgi:hypothetical protein
MMIGMNRAISPLGALETLFRQRPEMGQLFCPEHFIGSSLRGPVDLYADFILASPLDPKPKHSSIKTVFLSEL